MTLAKFRPAFRPAMIELNLQLLLIFSFGLSVSSSLGLLSLDRRCRLFLQRGP